MAITLTGKEEVKYYNLAINELKESIKAKREKFEKTLEDDNQELKDLEDKRDSAKDELKNKSSEPKSNIK